MKFINYITLASLIALLCTSCEKKPIDEDIEGMWKMEQFTTIEDGVVHNECQRIFISIQLQLVQLNEKQCEHGYGTYIGHFSYNDDHSEVTMKDFKYQYSSTTTGDDGIDATVEELLPYGINATETTFRVLEADGSRLVLQSDYATLELTSF